MAGWLRNLDPKMLASLPMYDLPEMRQATDGFWAAMAQRLGVSIALDRDADWTSRWHSSNLLFSQTCGYPLTHGFKDVLLYIATPHYDADGCEGPNYRSILLARESKALGDFRGKIAAFNSRDSMSGMLALKAVFASHATAGDFFSTALETGGHLASLAAVQTRHADICAIDCVTVSLFRRYQPERLSGLVEVARSPLVPGLPYVTRCGDMAELRAALATVMAEKELLQVRQALLLNGHSVLPLTAYNVIPALQNHVQSQGGLKLW
jgi:ABC-type phosphate/phosphonate transport system substrate-binding protein